MNQTVSKIEVWLADARQAIADGNQQAAEKYLQVAESIANQPGVVLPPDFSFDEIKTEITNLASAPAENTGGADFVPLDRSSVSQGNLEASAQNSLLKARQELALGNSVQAAEMLNAAKTYQVDFSKLGDSPENIEQLIARQNELVQMARGNDLEAYNQQAASFLLSQADALIAYQDYATAEKLVAGAKAVSYTHLTLPTIYSV